MSFPRVKGCPTRARLSVGIGRPFAGTPIKIYVADLNIRVVTEDGKLLRALTLDTTRIYQPRWKT